MMEDNVPIEDDNDLNNTLDGYIFFEEFLRQVMCIVHLKIVDLNQFNESIS